MKTSKTINITAGATIAILFAGVFATSAYADVTRNVTSVLQDRAAGGRTIDTAPAPIPSPTPTPTPTPPPPSGGITSVTDGSVSSGGNTGGVVTTGDEHVSVHEVNIGPTNPPPVAVGGGGEVTPPPAEPPCSTDRRAPNQCPVEVPSRTR